MNPVSTAPSRKNLINRVNLLASFFADQLRSQGWARAIVSTATELVLTHIRSRIRQFRETISKLDIRYWVWGSRKGVLFIGYVEGALGLGQAFRANLNAAMAARIPFFIYPFRSGIETRMLKPYMADRYDVQHIYDFNIIEVAADQVQEVFRVVSPRILSSTYNILCTYWELPRAPDAWRNDLRNIHEIWAPNQFIADAFASIFDGPIVIVPPAMEDTGGKHPGRTQFGMEADRFYFMFSFDYYSSPFRKNPLGVLRAFQHAFPVGDENVGLIIKSTGAPDHFPEIKAEIASATTKDSRIQVFDGTMGRSEMLGLIQSCDSYVSLHRAEGFGLGMAEAMTFERIVIATDYSGSTDFLTHATGYPVPYRLRPLEPHEYPWSEGQSWAEPDELAAATIMRSVVENPEQGRSRGKAARAFVQNRYSPSAVGEHMKKRLDALRKLHCEVAAEHRWNDRASS